MASLEVFNTPDDSESFQSDDFSYLHEISSGDMQNKEINHHNNGSFNFTNMQSALTTASSDDSSVEVHSQISRMIEENNLLKEKLDENNQMLERNLKEAKEIISALKNENVGLRETVASLKKNETKACKCETLETGLNNMLGVNYVEENAHLLMEWSYFRENLYGNLKYICQQLEDISNSKKHFEEKNLLNCYILMLKFKMAFLGGNEEVISFASLQTDEETGFEVVNLKIHENAQQLNRVIEDLVKVLKNRDEELTSLKMERDNFVEKIKGYELKLQECELVLKSQSELLNNKLQEQSSVPLQNREKCKSLEQEIKRLQDLKKNGASMSNDRAEEPKEELCNLKETSTLEQQTNKIDNDKLSNVMTKCEKLHVDCSRLTKLLEIQLRGEKEKKKELSLKDNDMKTKMEEVGHLTAELDKLQGILVEKDAKLQMLGEKVAKYREERIKEFQEKKPHLSRNQSSSDQKDQNGKADGNILCPICGIGFTDEHVAQNHANMCLDKSE